MSTTTAQRRRSRASSLSQGLADIPTVALSSDTTPPVGIPKNGTVQAPQLVKKLLKISPPTFLEDIRSFRWMTNPITSLKILVGLFTLWATFEFLPALQSHFPAGNPLSPFLFISYPLEPNLGEVGQRYGKGILDLEFLAFYIIVFSFLRQAVTEYLIRPLANSLGLKTNLKQLRFMEQAYAIIYNVVSGGVGLWIMYEGPSWWYQTEHLWLGYPHWRMTTTVKYYYLAQTAYWLQQMLVLSLRLEKPRSDYYQLIVHHVVTLWLVGWSYSTSLNVIGVAIFVSMDIPEIFLGASKCLNYIGAQRASECSFVALLLVWTYMRHYLNLKILWSVWYEFDLIPIAARSWQSSGPNDWWILFGVPSGLLPDWIRYQIFIPIFLLQLVNGFWSFLLWRILFRLVVGIELRDDREDGDDETAPVEDKKRR